jgi:hypothetical protein
MNRDKVRQVFEPGQTAYEYMKNISNVSPPPGQEADENEVALGCVYALEFVHFYYAL